MASILHIEDRALLRLTESLHGADYAFYIRSMRFSPEQLRDKALHAVEEAFDQCQAGPVPPSRALRFALAYLANRASGREWFDMFWKSVTGAYDQEWGPQASDLLRVSNARAGIVGIYRALGLDRPSGLL